MIRSLRTSAAAATLALFALASAASAGSAWDWAIATTTYGAVRGRPMLSANGRIYAAFLGIPYAQPPLGDLRFRSPRPPKPWRHVRDARKHPSVCPQISPMATEGSPSVIGDEDCLYLNVYSRHAGEGEWSASMESGHRRRGFPVLVWIHGGGGFAAGSASGGGLSPEMLMDREMVVVVPQFRLGVLGFLSTGNGLAAGNYALKDQAMALRWVQANAAAFGGDPRRVTVAGAGSGAALAHLLAVSPFTRGLLHRAVVVGSSALAPWAFQNEPRTAARALAAAVSCAPEGNFRATPLDEKVLQCLRRANAATLVVASSKFAHWSAGGATAFAPVVERERQQAPGVWVEPRIISEHPEQLVRSRAQPPILFASATGASALLPTPLLRADSVLRRAALRELRDALQRMLVRGSVGSRASGVSSLTASALTLQKALSHYGGTLGDGDVRPLADALADGWLGHSASLAARRAAPFSSNPVYFMLMDLGPGDVFGRGKKREAPGDETTSVPRTASEIADFLEQQQPKPGPLPQSPQGVRRTAQALSLVLEAFASKGQPSPARWTSAREWRPLGRAGRFRLLLSARDGVRAQDAPNALLSRLEFWDEQVLGIQRFLSASPPLKSPKTRKMVVKRPVKPRTVRTSRVRSDESKSRRARILKKEAAKKPAPTKPQKVKVSTALIQRSWSTCLESSKQRLKQLQESIWKEFKKLQVSLNILEKLNPALKILPVYETTPSRSRKEKLSSTISSSRQTSKQGRIRQPKSMKTLRSRTSLPRRKPVRRQSLPQSVVFDSDLQYVDTTRFNPSTLKQRVIKPSQSFGTCLTNPKK